MKSNEERNRLLDQKKKLEYQLKDLNFKGYPEIKNVGNNKYIYLRYKSYDKNSSQYIGPYSEDLYNNYKLLAKNVKTIKTEIRLIRQKLTKYGYREKNLSTDTIKCVELARNNLKYIIYGQCVIEGVAATFLETEQILDDNEVKSVDFTSTLKIKNLKNAWQYILDDDTLKRTSFFYSVCDIAGFINDRLVSYGDQLRSVDVNITGTTYKPPLPTKEVAINTFDKIINSSSSNLAKAIDIFCYISKYQLFPDGNKRTALIAANLFLIQKGEGYLSISQDKNDTFKKYLLDYYKAKNKDIKKFLEIECFHKINDELEKDNKNKEIEL